MSFPWRGREDEGWVFLNFAFCTSFGEVEFAELEELGGASIELVARLICRHYCWDLSFHAVFAALHFGG